MKKSRTKDNIRTLILDKDLVVERRVHIAKCAAGVFAKKGYDKANVREISEACGVGIGTIYRYVGAKEDILYLVTDQGLKQLSDFSNEVIASLESLHPVEALKEAIRKYYLIMDTYQDMMVLAYQEARNLKPAHRKRVLGSDTQVVAAFEKLLSRGCELGEFNIADIPMLAHDILVMGQMWAARRWFLRNRCTLDEYIRSHTEFILNAICNNPAKQSGCDAQKQGAYLRRSSRGGTS